MNATTQSIDVPPPPVVPNQHVYYFIYGEWIQVLKQSAIATPENPNPSGMLQRAVGINECIDMHPAVFMIAAQGARPGYTIKWATGISKDLYEWYKEVEKRIKDAQVAMMQGAPDNGAGGLNAEKELS